MRQRVDLAGGQCEHRVEQAGQLDPLRLRDHPEVRARCVERALDGRGDDRQRSLAAAVEHALVQASLGVAVGELDGVSADGLGRHDRDRPAVRAEAGDGRARSQVFQSHRVLRSCRPPGPSATGHRRPNRVG